MHPLLRPTELHIHIAVDGDKAPGILRLAPFQADSDFVVHEGLEHRAGVEGDELCVDAALTRDITYCGFRVSRTDIVAVL